MSASTAPASTIPCPRCQAPASGKFCASCGAPLEGARCAGCASLLTPGARFCHRCGLAAGADATGPGRGAGAAVREAGGASTAGAPGRNALPWSVAAIALLAVVALVAGQRLGTARGGALDAPSNALPVPGLDDRGIGAGMAGGDPNRARTDIANMSPEERALRLYNRVMTLHEAGKRDSVVFFAPMAVTAFQMLDSLTLDQRYDLGRIGEISGIPDLAKAQADTILRIAPTHLLGLILSANVAGMRGEAAAQRQYMQRFMAAHDAEMAKRLPEYEGHANEIAAVRATLARQ